MIEMEDIKKSFTMGASEVFILKGISLYIGAGEFVSIMGPSGSGKSTLSSVLGCLSSPTSGKYLIDDKNVSHMGQAALARLRNQKIGFIFQDFNLLDGVSAVDNVALPLFYARVSASERRKKAINCLKKVGLSDRLYHVPRQLSGGQKQRVAIARALVNDPMFLFGDEPTGALDKKTGQEIMGLMQRLNLQGHTVVQVTHSPTDASYSKRILHLVDGLIVKDEMVERPTIGIFDGSVDEKNELMGRVWKIAQSTPLLTDENLSLLRKLLGDSTGSELLVEAVRAITRWEAVTDLINGFLKNEHWSVRAEAVKSLMARAKDFVLPYMFQALEDSNAWVRYLAANHLKKNWPMPLSEIQRKIVMSKLEDIDERVRATTVAFMAQWKDRNATEWFAKATTDKDGRVRANALDALAPCFLDKNPPAEIVALVKERLDDKNNRARANAALLTYFLDPKLAIETLSSMITSDNNLMRASSAWALGRITDEQAGLLLIDRLRLEHEDLVLNQVIRSLGVLTKSSFPLSRQISLLLQHESAPSAPPLPIAA
jgi:putative ABC transport system ATP-binding protein